MAVGIHNLIAAINPDIYCNPDKRSKVKSLVKEKGYLAAAEEAEPVKAAYIDIDEAMREIPFDKPGKKNPIEQHELSYDYAGSLEPIYFWILDYIDHEFDKTEKLTDNFISSAGSSHFVEMQGRATKMQEEAMKIFGLANTVLKSILNIIYDLKEFKLRLEIYDDLHSNEQKKRN